MLSAIVITKNEEKNIRDCLESIKGVVDEIILVDSYSSDKTIEVARKYTNKIFLKKFENDFAEQRNYALNRCKGSWILTIDADETLSPSLKKIIPKLINNYKFKGYLIPRRNYINKKTWLKHGLFYPDYQLRLFNNNKVIFLNKVDEYPNINNKYVKKIKAYLVHSSSRTKYDKFSSIFKARIYINIKSEELLTMSKSLIYYLLSGIYLFFKYFINSYILCKGYLDGYNGFRAALIFACFPLLCSFNVTIKKIYKIF